jgi:hypothetical protein
MNKWPVYCFCGWLVVVTAHIAYFCLRPNSLGKLVLGRHCRRRKTPENPFHLPEDKKLIIYNPFVAQITVHNSPPQHLLPPAIDAWLRRCRSCASARTQGRGGRCWGGGQGHHRSGWWWRRAALRVRVSGVRGPGFRGPPFSGGGG